MDAEQIAEQWRFNDGIDRDIFYSKEYPHEPNQLAREVLRVLKSINKERADRFYKVIFSYLD